MSAFTGRLEVAEIVTDTIWEVLAPFRYDSDVAQRGWDIPRGFLTDFASVKRAPIAYWLTGGTGDAAAVIHDYLYQTHKNVTRQLADAVFYEAQAVKGAPVWRRWLMYRAVREWGQPAWDSGPARFTVLEAMVREVKLMNEGVA